MATKQNYGKDGQVSTTLALVIGGKNTFGEVEEVKEIEYEQETVDDRPTGIWKPSTFSATLKTKDPKHVQSINNGEPFIVKGAINEDGKNIPYSDTLTIAVTKLSKGIKEGEYTVQTIEGNILTHSELVGGEAGINYKRDTMWLDLGDGKNVMENVANNTL